MRRKSILHSTSLSPILMARPLFMVLRPRSGSRTGSIVSPILSNKTTSPDAMALSNASRYPFWPIRMIFNSAPNFVLIHLIPCSWGSIMSGHRSQLVKMVAFSVDILSLGSPSLFQEAIWASSVNRVNGSSPSKTGIGCSSFFRKGDQYISIKSRRYCFVKAPK